MDHAFCIRSSWTRIFTSTVLPTCFHPLNRSRNGLCLVTYLFAVIQIDKFWSFLNKYGLMKWKLKFGSLFIGQSPYLLVKLFVTRIPKLPLQISLNFGDINLLI